MAGIGAGIAGGYGEERSQSRQTNTYDPWTDWIRGAAFDWLTQPGNMPDFWSGGDMGLGGLDLSRVHDISDMLKGFGTDLTAAEREGVGEFRKATDLGELKRAQGENFGFMVAPQIRNSLAAAGMGRSGAEAEQIAKAGVQSTVPLTALANQRQAELGQLISHLAAGAGARGLRSLESAGQLELGGAGLTNQRDIAGFQGMLGARSDIFGNLIRILAPLLHSQLTKGKGSQWQVTGQASGGMGTGSGGNQPSFFPM